MIRSPTLPPVLKQLWARAEKSMPTLTWLLRVAWRTIMKFSEIDGEQRAASFAYYAFLSLFPLVLLLFLFVSQFRDPEGILPFIQNYIPLSSTEEIGIRTALNGFIDQRGKASLIALLGVAWTSLRFFQALVRGVNRAWGTIEYSWWRLPIKNLLMVAIMATALLIGLVAPTILNFVQAWLERYSVPYATGLIVWVFALANRLVPLVVLFFGFLMFYKTAPRRHPAFRYVWVPALVVTLMLQALQALFILYAKNFANFNAIYGAFGGAIALLMWIYFSGSVIILGGCMSASTAEALGKGAAEAAEEG